MDGTLYLGDRLFPDTLAFLKEIRGRGRTISSSPTTPPGARGLYQKADRLGHPLPGGGLFTSTHAAIHYLSKNHPSSLVYALPRALPSFKDQLHIRRASRPTDRLTPGIDCLLMGYDTELTYQKLVDACHLINQGLPYLATNLTGSAPLPRASCRTAAPWPRCWSMPPAASHVLGKPRPDIALLALEQKGCRPGGAWVLIGDRVYTDSHIACARAAGLSGVLVLSGETKREALADSHIQPDFVCAYPACWPSFGKKQ